MIRIERADAGDVDRIAPLFDDYRQFYEQPSDPDGARRFIGNRLSRNESVIFLAVEENRAPTRAVGFTQLYPVFSSVSMRSTWILNDLFVAPDARRRGVGRLLMQRAIDFARDEGAKALSLQTAEDNREAQRLYESLGFVHDTVFRTYAVSLDR